MAGRKVIPVSRPMLTPLYLVLCTLVLCSSGHAEDVVKGNFDLIDHHGRSVTEHSFDGKLRLVYFGFTRCPDICPTTLFEVARVMRRLGDDASNVQPIFISVDRENDTPEILASYVAAFHPTMIGLTGSRQQMDAVAKSFNVTYGVDPASDGDSGVGNVYHSAYLFLMDRKGGFIDVFGYGAKAEVIETRLRENF
jgi:protein SCO1/2